MKTFPDNTLVAFLSLFAISSISFTATAENSISQTKLYENAEVTVSLFSIAAKASSGFHNHPNKRIEIMLKGGKGIIRTEAGADEYEFPTGTPNTIEPNLVDHNFTNLESEAMEWIGITFKNSSGEKDDNIE